MIEEVIPDALEGERLDRVVAMLGACSRSAASLLVTNGAVSVDGNTNTQRSARVHAGMLIAFEPVWAETSTVEADASVEFEVVHVDDDVIIVNKPVGLVVHPGAGRPDGTLVNGLVARFPELVDIGDPVRPGIVHRLDADTSGLLVVARSSEAYGALVQALAEHRVERVYTAVVHGSVTDDRGVVDAPIGRSTQRRTRMAVLAEGREARTHYEVQARRPHEPQATLLTCRLETGRTHQIRVHLSAIGHPVVGDATYGARRRSIEFGRVALHARELEFSHPVTGSALHFEAEIPDDLRSLALNLELSPENAGG